MLLQKKIVRVLVIVAIVIGSCLPFQKLLAQKTITPQQQAWVSLNNWFRLSDHWGAIADFHVKRSKFFSEPNFYFIRFAGSYYLTNNISLVGGYAHMWLAPTTQGWKTYTNENRVYEQLQYTSKVGSISMVQRIRNEQRWMEQIVNDSSTHKYRLSNRVRYLLSFQIPLSSNKYVPAIALSDEIALQFGKYVGANTFDQNRLFIGIAQKVSNSLWFDLGYMMEYQEKSSGTAYDQDHIFRWFFYYTPDFRKHHSK